MEWWHYAGLALAALAAGFVDAIAGGGGLLTVPALLWAGLDPAVALGTNKMQSCCGTALAVRNYARAGLLREQPLLAGILWTAGAAAVGAMVVSRVPVELLRRSVPWLLIVIAIYTAVSPKMSDLHGERRVSGGVFACGFGLLLGFYDGAFGPGTGSFWTMACVLLLGLGLRHATAYTKVMNLTSNLASLAVFLWAGVVRFEVAGVMIAGQLAGAQLGSGMVLKNGSRVIRPVLITTVLLMAGKLLWEQWRR
jgi:uncharacterized membrane protein YfcA